MRAALLALVLSFAATPALADVTFGEGVHGDDTVLISTMLASPDDYVGKTVRVQGLITDVCQKRGCWVAIASDQEFQTLRFKVKDGVIVFTPDVKGRKGTFEGTLARYELTMEQSLERARHHAEEQGKDFDPSTITGPEVYYQLEGTGAVVED